MADGSGYLLMALIALQVGIQPQVTRTCVAKEVSGQSLVLAELLASILLAKMIVPWSAFGSWSLGDSLLMVGPPAAAYALRSFVKQAAYRRCDGVTFNVMNQTKVVFCALATWLLLGETQSLRQCLALCCAVGAGALLLMPTQSAAAQSLPRGVSGALHTARLKQGGRDAQACGALLALATAVCSGTAAALSQAAMQRGSRPSALFNLELGLWGLPFVLMTGNSMHPTRLLQGWRWCTFAPVALQAVGGILVSAVVKTQGGVAMGLCTVAGISVSAIIDAATTQRPPTLHQVFAACLCGLSVWIHQLNASS